MAVIVGNVGTLVQSGDAPVGLEGGRRVEFQPSIERHIELSARLLREHVEACPTEIDPSTLGLRALVLLRSLAPAEKDMVFDMLSSLSGQGWLSDRLRETGAINNELRSLLTLAQ